MEIIGKLLHKEKKPSSFTVSHGLFNFFYAYALNTLNWWNQMVINHFVHYHQGTCIVRSPECKSLTMCFFHLILPCAKWRKVDIHEIAILFSERGMVPTLTEIVCALVAAPHCMTADPQAFCIFSVTLHCIFVFGNTKRLAPRLVSKPNTGVAPSFHENHELISKYDRWILPSCHLV